MVPNERRLTPQRIKTDPALRVAPKNAPDCVAKLAKGTTLHGVPRLVWHIFRRQRGS